MSFAGTVLVIAAAGWVVLTARCVDRTSAKDPVGFICSNGDVSNGFIVGTSVVGATVLVGGATAAVVFGVLAFGRHGSQRWPQPVAVLTTVVVAAVAAARAGAEKAAYSAESTTAAGAVLQGLIAAGVVGALAALIVGVILALAAHLIARRLAKSSS